MSHNRIFPRASLFGIAIDRLTMGQAVSTIGAWLHEPHAVCRLVVTPNVDHIVLLENSARLRQAYARASLVLADGWPLVAVSKWLGQPLPERVAGSDLVPHVLAACGAQRPFTTFLLGAMPGVGERAAHRIAQAWPANRIVGTCSPPWGFERDAEQSAKVLQQLRGCTPDLLIVGLGAPKQEIWLSENLPYLPCKVAVAAGATIDFLAGEQRRAPVWCQQWGLEWCYRMCRDPRRLVRRYAHDAWSFPRILLREWHALRAGS